MPPVTEGYIAEPVGECSITRDVGEGPFVRSPYMVTQQMVGRPLVIGAPTIRAFGSAVGLVQWEKVAEDLDRKDAVIYDQKAIITKQDEKLKMLRPAAERYFILKGQENGTNFEERIAELEAQVAKKDKALQQLNRGGRPQKAVA